MTNNFIRNKIAILRKSEFLIHLLVTSLLFLMIFATADENVSMNNESIINDSVFNETVIDEITNVSMMNESSNDSEIIDESQIINETIIDNEIIKESYEEEINSTDNKSSSFITSLIQNMFILGDVTQNPIISFIAPSPSQNGRSFSTTTINASVNETGNSTYAFFNDGLV